MQQGAPEESLHDLQMAAELGPDNSDVFHHRGQVLSIYSLKKKKKGLNFILNLNIIISRSVSKTFPKK